MEFATLLCRRPLAPEADDGRSAPLTHLTERERAVDQGSVPVREALVALSPYTPQPRDIAQMLQEGRKHIWGNEIAKIKATLTGYTPLTAPEQRPPVRWAVRF